MQIITFGKLMCLFLILLFPSEFFMPGLVDAHIHAPQYSFTGIRGNLTLLKWLEKTTYPVEAEFKKIDFAEEVYTRAVVRQMSVCLLVSLSLSIVPLFLITINISGFFPYYYYGLQLYKKYYLGKVMMNFI